MRHWCLGVGLLFLTVGTVQGHHLWILPAEKGDSARVVWSDDLKPDNKDEPLTTIEKAQVLLRDAEGRIETLKWKQDNDVYRVACPGSGQRTLAVVWNDERVKTGTTLSTYLCKVYLADPTGKVSKPKKGTPWEQLGLELLPRPDRGADVYQAVYKGQPVPNVKVVPECDEQLWKQLNETQKNQLSSQLTDKEGLVTFKPPRPGLYALWVRHIFEEKGEHQGRPYSRRRYISCLAFHAPARDR